MWVWLFRRGCGAHAGGTPRALCLLSAEAETAKMCRFVLPLSIHVCTMRSADVVSLPVSITLVGALIVRASADCERNTYIHMKYTYTYYFAQVRRPP